MSGVSMLYTPQQMRGSAKFRPNTLLGNWNEDRAEDEHRLATYVEEKETQMLASAKVSQRFGKQLAPVTLSSAGPDGGLRFGDVFQLRSCANRGCLAVSLGQRMPAAEDRHPVFCTNGDSVVSRCALRLESFDGSAADGEPVCYGQKVMIRFLDELGEQGALASEPANAGVFGTQLTNKQETYFQQLPSGKMPYSFAWQVQPAGVERRAVQQGQAVTLHEPCAIVHCYTNKRLAGTGVPMPNDFGTELAVCVHTFTQITTINAISRERGGLPQSGFGSRPESDENLWDFVLG